MTFGEQVTIARLEEDPYPIYARMRAEEPVSVVPAAGLTFVTRWADVRRVARDAEVFSAALPDSPLSRTLGPNLLHSDGSHHSSRRAPLAHALRPAALRHRIETVVGAEIAQLLDGWAERGAGDLVGDFAEPLAVRTLQVIAGLPTSTRTTMRAWFEGIASGAANFEGDAAKQERADAAGTAIDEVVAATLANGPQPGTLIADLAAAATDTGPGTVAEISATVKLLVIGGMQEPRDLVGLALAALLVDQRQRAALAADPALLPRVIEEALRWGAPVGTVTRRVLLPVELAGVELAPDTVVAGIVASANRDADRWADADTFDALRPLQPHLAFGSGPHVCVGAAMARIEARLALPALLEGLPDLRLVEQPVQRGWEFRGPVALRAAWTPC